MRRTLQEILTGLLALACLSGCAGLFHGGDPEMDRSGCEVKCHSWGMRLSGMMALGRSHSGCLCENSGGKTTLGAASERPHTIVNR